MTMNTSRRSWKERAQHDDEYLEKQLHNPVVLENHSLVDKGELGRRIGDGFLHERDSRL